MNFAFRKLTKTFPQLNQISHTAEDFWDVCETKSINVWERKFKKKGYYVADKIGDFIFIDSRLKNFLWLNVAFHELTHALLHFPSPWLADRQQFEANAFSIMMLCPLSELDAGSELRDAAAYDHVARFIIKEREKIYFLHQDFGVKPF